MFTFSRTNILLCLCLIAGCNLPETKVSSTTVNNVGIVSWASFSNDNSLVALGNGKISGVTLYEIDSQKKHLVWDTRKWNKEALGLSAAFHPTNTDIIACCDQENIDIVNWKEKKILFRLPIEYGYVPGIAFSKNGSHVFAVHSFFEDKVPEGWDIKKEGPYCISEILIIDIESKTIVDKIIVDNNIIQGVDFNSNCERVALRYMGGEADIWDLKNGRRIQSVKHWHGSKCIKFIDEKTFLTDGFPDDCVGNMVNGNVVWWDIDKGKPIKIFNNLHSMALHGMGIIYDKKGNKYILSGGEDRRAILWHLDTGKVIWSKRFKFDVIVATSKDGHVGVISADGDPIIMHFDF
jgi:WD40 repeat protein